MKARQTEPVLAGGLSGIIRAGVAAVPAVKYALGVAAVIAALALVKGYFSNAGTALLAGVGMIVLMVLLLVFAAASKSAGAGLLRAPALVFTWTIIVFFISSGAMTISSIFFAWPTSITALLKQPSAGKYLPIEKPALPSGIKTTPLTIVVESTGAAAQAATQFAQELSKPDASARAEQRLEKEQLKQVIEDLVSIEYMQAPLPWLLRAYVRDGNFGNWEQVKLVINSDAKPVSDLVDLMEKFDGDLVYKDLETYRQLRTIVSSRAGLYGELASMKPPPTDQEKAQLLQIADNFDVLISQTKLIEKKLSDYLKE